jgi:hypothetical protein
MVKHSSSRAMFARVKVAGYPIKTSAGVSEPNVRYAKMPIARLDSNANTIEYVDTLRQVCGVCIG